MNTSITSSDSNDSDLACISGLAFVGRAVTCVQITGAPGAGKPTLTA